MLKFENIQSAKFKWHILTSLTVIIKKSYKNDKNLNNLRMSSAVNQPCDMKT
jgi:hypothetical protein